MRTLAQLRLLATDPAVTRVRVLAVSEDRDEAANEAARSALEAASGCSVAPPVFHPVHVRAFPAFAPRLLLNRTAGRLPYVAAKWDAPAVRRRLRAELAAAPYDVVYLDHLGTAAFLDDVRALAPKARIVLDQHNVETEFFAQLRAAVPSWARPLAAFEERACGSFEAQTLRAVDAVIAISDADAATFAQVAGVEAVVVPPLVRAFRKPFAPVEERTVCFVGSLTWAPNVAGVEWLCQRVWPEARKLDAALRLVVCGAGLPTDGAGRPRVPASFRGEGIEVRGFVDDLDLVYRRCFAMVAPVVGGSGVRIKLLEGMRAGLPVVTNGDGVRGLPLTSGRELLVEDDPVAFARALVTLAGDTAKQERLRESAYDYLERNHGEAVVRSALHRALGLTQVGSLVSSSPEARP